MRVLLEFLAAQGYVSERAGGYGNTPTTTRWLTTASETNLAPWFTFWNELAFPFWEAHLERAIHEGSPSRSIYEWFDEEPTRWDTAQAGFRAAATLTVGEVTEKLDLPDDVRRVLDVGGGHGLYAVELCRTYPGLAATVFDSRDALELARRERRAAGVDTRVELVAGDYWTDHLGEDYDLALVFNVVHAHDATANRRLFGRVADALRPCGRVAVLDQLAGSARTPVGRSGLGFVGLTYLATLGARTHPYADVAEWLRDAGFEDVTRTPIRRAGPGNTLVQARRIAP
jgi:SAM-dependent methyltransferase